MKNQLVYTHGDFYRAFIGSIGDNYSEIVPVIEGHNGENQTDGNSEHDAHSHGEEDFFQADSPWSHFEADLGQFPYVKRLRILDARGVLLWSYDTPGYNSEFGGLPQKEDASVPDEGYLIYSLDDTFLVQYVFPIEIDGNKIGTVRITDIDPELKGKISDSQLRQISLIVLGGIVFYLSLFILYYRMHRKQALTIRRLDESQSLTIETMSRLAELRDDNTGAHIRRTSLYCRELAEELAGLGEYSSYLTPEYIRDLERSAPLHDIGKVGVPDSILQKPGPLSAEEFNVIKTHPILGADVLRNAADRLGFQSFFVIGYQIVLHHHENWDGSGYPDGLSGSEIPLSARIMAVADVYDALTTNRPYKEAFSHERAMAIISGDSGSKFDPLIVKALDKRSGRFEEISRLNQDGS